MKEGKKEGKKAIDFTSTSHAPLFPPSAIAPCCMHLRLSWLFPSHSCHTQKTHTQLPFSPHLFFFPTSPQQHINPLYITLLQLCTKFLCCYSCSDFLDCIVFFFFFFGGGGFFFFFFFFGGGGVFFAQKCCFFVNLQLLVCLFVYFFDLLAIDKLLQVHSNSTEL